MIPRSAFRPKPPAELLEARIAPAAIATPATFTYTDADGDVVKVQIAGKRGSAEFLTAGGADISGGGNIASIIITTPSPDFSISFSDTNTGLLGGNDTISLGAITGPAGARVPLIKGIFTAATSSSVEYDLTSFLGTGFLPGGGLKIIGALKGDASAQTVDLDVTTLAANTAVTFTDGIAAAASATVKTMAGTFTTGNLAGVLTLGRTTGYVQTGHIAGQLIFSSDLLGTLSVGDAAQANTLTTEEITIQGNLGARAHIESHQNVNLHVTKNLAGSVLVSGNLSFDVAGNLVGADLSSAQDVSFTVTGVTVASSIIASQDILSGSKLMKAAVQSSFLTGTGLDMQVGGSITGSRFSGGTSDLTLTTTGRMQSSQVTAGGDADVTTGFVVDGCAILPDGRLTLTIGQQPMNSLPGTGDLTRSTVGSKSTSATVTVGGRVAGSQLSAATDLILTAGSAVGLDTVRAGNDFTLTAGGNVGASKFIVGSDADVTIGGRVAASSFLTSNNLDLKVGSPIPPVTPTSVPIPGILSSRLEASDGDITVTVQGIVANTLIESGQSVNMTLNDFVVLNPTTSQLQQVQRGSIGTGVPITAADDITITASSNGAIAGSFVGGRDISIQSGGVFRPVGLNAARDLTISAAAIALPPDDFTITPHGTQPVVLAEGTAITGLENPITVLARGGIRIGGDLKLDVTGNVVLPLLTVGGDVNEFAVGGNLGGKIYVAGKFVTGTTTSAATVVGGIVAPSALLHIGGDLGDATSSPSLTFAHGFAGRIEVGGNVAADLTFGGDVTNVVIGGRIGTGAANNAVADIIVHGKLKSLYSASVFNRTGTGTGDFIDVTGAATGHLTADNGAPLVTPFEITPP